MTRIYLITFIFLIAGCLTAKKKAEFSVSVPENLSIAGEMQLTNDTYGVVYFTVSPTSPC